MSSNADSEQQTNCSYVFCADAAHERDGRDCRTEKIVDEISRCLMNGEKCEYSCPFGESYFCKHPRHLEFRKKAGTANWHLAPI